MFKRPLPVPKEKESAPNFKIDLDFINRTIEHCHTVMSGVVADGLVEDHEYRKVLKELELCEKVLIMFIDKTYITKRDKLIKDFNKIFKKIDNGADFSKEEMVLGFISGADRKEGNLELLYFSQCSNLFGELVRLATKASFYGGALDGE